MPYCKTRSDHWKTDSDLFEAIPGGQALRDWLGYVSDFHDAQLIKIDQEDASAKLNIEAFRITSQIDPHGFFVVDRHANVTLTLTGVTHAVITSELPTTLQELGIRRSIVAPNSLEICFDDVMGEGGAILATSAKISFVPSNEEPNRNSS